MADTGFDANKYLKAFDPTKPNDDSFNYQAFLSDVSGIAEKTRQVGGPASISLPDFQLVNQPDKTTGKYVSQYRPWFGDFGHYALETIPQEPANTAQRKANMATAGAAVETYTSQRKAMEKDAEKAAAALEIKAAGTAESMKRMASVASGIAIAKEGSAALYARAGQEIEDYQRNVKDRAAASMAKLEETYKEMGKNRDFSQAHATQAGVQATIGTMNEEGRNVAERYGTDSMEYKEWEGRKSASLATLNSNITATYQQFRETQDNAFLNATNEQLWRSDQYASFADQSAVEGRLAIARYSDEFSLNASQLQISLEQMRGTALDDIANWIQQTPSYYMDATPTVSLLGELSTSYLTDAQINGPAQTPEFIQETLENQEG